MAFFGARVWEFLIAGLAIYTVLDEESDFQVKNIRFLCQKGKNMEKQNSKKLFVNL